MTARIVEVAAASAQLRVPTISWVSPPDELACVASSNPARRATPASRRVRQVGDTLGQVGVGGAVGQRSADLRHDLAEVDAVAPAHQPVLGHADVEQGDPTAGLDDTTRAPSKNVGRSTRLRSANPHMTPSTEASGTGSRRMSVWTRDYPSGLRRASRSSGPSRSGASRRRPGRCTGHRCRSRDRAPCCPRGKARSRNGTLAPAHVEPERDDPIEPVVLRGDRVEHVADRSDLLVTLGQLVGVPGSCGVHDAEATAGSTGCSARRAADLAVGLLGSTPSRVGSVR